MLRRQRNLPVSTTSRRSSALLAGDSSPASRRSGLTLVEMMVAVVMLAIGLLGLASTSGYVVRQVGSGAKQTTVAHVAQARVEWLRSIPCTAIKDSNTVTRGIKEKWKVHSTVNGVARLTQTLEYSAGGSKKNEQVFDITVQCG